MINLESLANTVQTNCHISDAKYAGNYTLCTFLLKMREYYRWEKQLPLSQKLAKSDVGQWISNRELDWDNFEEMDFEKLIISDKPIDPFEAQKINDQLNTMGYVYSSGYGLFGKPNFFLADLVEKQQIDALTVYISEKEYARDLSAPPAMIIGDTIFIRRESLKRYLWEKIEEWKWKHDPLTPMGRTLNFYQTQLNTEDYEAILDAMCTNETQSAIYHEIGEAKAGKILGELWRELLADLPHSTLELTLRAIKDHLADSITTLPTLIEEENNAGLHFYFANLTGMRKEIFPEALDAYEKWINTNQPSVLKQLCKISYDKWLSIANDVKTAYQNHRDQWQQIAEQKTAILIKN